MTKQKLYCDFVQAIFKSSKIEKKAREIIRIADNGIASEIENIDSNWHGEASDVFIQKGRTIQSDLNDVANSLIKTAELIRKVAKRVYDTEMKALEIAESRTYR